MTTLTTPDPSAGQRPLRALGDISLSVADVLFGVILLGAALLRLSQLDALPLNPLEAREALAVWQAWQPGAMLLTPPYSPIYFSITTLLSQILGSTDLIMRLAPALAGVALVAAPWALRAHLGRAGALAAAFFLAISPMAAITARTAGGSSFALLAIMALAVAFWRYAITEGSRWRTLFIAAIAIGLTSATHFYTGLTALAVAVLLSFGPAAIRSAWVAWQPFWQRSFLILTALIIAISTLLLWNLWGLGAAASLLGEWLGHFSLEGGLIAWLRPVANLVRYEPGLVILGVVGLSWSVLQERPLARFLALWSVTALLIATLQHLDPTQVAIALVPLALLAGLLIDRALAIRPSTNAIALALFLLLAAVLSYTNLVRYLGLARTDPSQFSNLWIAVVIATLGVVTVVYVRGFDPPAALFGAATAIVAMSGLFGWGTAWWLTHYAANDLREGWVVNAADADIRLLTEMMHEISRQTRNAEAELDIVVASSAPLLRWYLRDFEQAQFGATVPPAATNDVIIAPVNQTPLLGADYWSSDFAVARVGVQPAESSQSNPLRALRWLLIHDSPDIIVQQRMTVWVRSDLGQR